MVSAACRVIASAGWAYLRVVAGSACPSSLPMASTVSPSRSAMLAWVWRRSWRRASPRSASARMRHQKLSSQCSQCARPVWGDGKDPTAGPRDAVEDGPRGRGQPDGPRSGLGVAQEQAALAVVGPAERQDLALAASGQKEQADRGDLPRTRLGVRRERPGEPPDLVVRQEPLAPLAAVSPDAPAGVGALGPQPHPFRPLHDNGEDRHGPVGGGRRRGQRGEPVAHLAPVDIGDIAPREMGHDLVAEVAPVDSERARFPDPLVLSEHGFRDGLEERLLGTGRRGVAPPDRGQHPARARARLDHAHRLGVAYDLPHSFAAMLAMDEEALAA